MALPDHETFEPGGRAWALADDAVRHLVNKRPICARNAFQAMAREMRANGADSLDIKEWEEFSRLDARDPETIKQYIDDPEGPNPLDYISVDGRYNNSTFEGRDARHHQ